jgi:putative transposase
MDNEFIERLWHSLEYEEVYLHAYQPVNEAKIKVDEWMKFYNQK